MQYINTTLRLLVFVYIFSFQANFLYELWCWQSHFETNVSFSNHNPFRYRHYYLPSYYYFHRNCFYYYYYVMAAENVDL